MNEPEIKRIVHDTVQETLKALGVDMDEPFEVQKDLAYLRSWRQAAETVRSTSLMTAVGIIITGMIALIVAKLRGSI